MVMVGMLSEKVFAKALPVIVPLVAVVLMSAAKVRLISGCCIC